MRFELLVLLVAAAAALPPPSPSRSAASPPPPPYPTPTDKALDCAIRAAAWEFAQSLQDGPQAELFDALQLAAYCSQGRPPGGVRARTSQANTQRTGDQGGQAFYLDAGIGDDAGAGSASHPFRTLARGVRACRGSAARPCTLLLNDTAPFHLEETLVLTAIDAGLTIAALPGALPEVTGMRAITAQWEPASVGQGRNIWRAVLTGNNSLSSQPKSVHVFGRRAVLARFPNCNDPETDILPTGYTSASGWLPTRPAPPTVPIVLPSADRSFDVFFPDWTWALQEGPRANFEPPEGYWLNPHPNGGSMNTVPTGFRYNPSQFSPRVNLWTDLSAASVHVFHGGYWGNWMFGIDHVDTENSTLVFGPGGWQEARGSSSGGALFVEGIFEELDAPGEWFYDASQQSLYLWYNATQGTEPPSNGEVTVAQLEQLISVSGTTLEPVRNITISGITFWGSQTTFLSRPFTAPSGGDWSFANTAAVVLQGTVGAAITNCTLRSLGGNGILLRGFNRDTAIANNTFSRLGDSGIVTFGLSALADLTALEVPANTLITGNVFSELGVEVKQAGGLYSAISANHTVTENIFYNLPRAAININDGAHGGHHISRNLFVNAVRETQDHGALNTWDRQPYIQTWAGEQVPPVLLPAESHISSNFFINNYFSIHSLDHDDGSNSFLDTGNVLAYSGMKNYLGFAKKTIGNLVIQPDFAGPNPVTAPGEGRAPYAGVPLPLALYLPYCARSVGQHPWGTSLADVFQNNTCILSSTEAPYYLGTCNPASPAGDGSCPLTAHNTFYTPEGTYTVKCGSTNLTLAAAQAVGYDIGSTVRSAKDLAPADVVRMIRDMLGF
jgi:hypothetical protein